MKMESLYHYQDRMASDFLGEGDDGIPKNLIVQAPTGSGKTLGAIYPGIVGFSSENLVNFPQKIVYNIPMRVLARGLKRKYEEYSEIFDDWHPSWNAHIQTGEMPEDELFQNRFIFATVDQMLASFLNIPYGIPKRLDNINAGAFIGSYLVFDEFHLYPTQEMLLTVLAMLKMLKDVSRFVLMSATFSPALLTAIAKELGAKPIFDTPDTPLLEGIFSDIKTLQNQQRRWKTCEGSLNGLAIEAALQEHRTVLVICNQVERAQQVYREFKSRNADIDCRLLHSRFYSEDRRRIENDILEWLGQKKDDGQMKVIIATQVVEVGLDISAEILLTECAPAASLIQRAGRCARWGGAGDVWVYQPPIYPETGLPNYAPYFSDGLEDVCKLTWDTLSSSEFDGKILPYNMEQKLVKAAHEAHDKTYLIDGLSTKLDNRIERITRCMNERHEGYVGELIRNQDNNSARVYIMGKSTDERITHKLESLEALNISKGLLKRAYEHAKDNEIDADFLFKAGEAVEEEYEEAEQIRTRTVYNWEHPLKAADDVYKQRLLLAHPDVLGYTDDMGVYINTDFSPAPESPQKSDKQSRKSYSINADTYVQHIAGLHFAYTTVYDFSEDGKRIFYRPLYHEVQYAIMSLLKRMGRDETWDEVDGYMRLMLALHDVGKLNIPWQKWAQERHKLYCEKFGANDKVPTDGTPLAHTAKGSGMFVTVDEQKAFEAEFKQKYRASRGNHAVESAEAVCNIVWQATKGEILWFSVIIAAICHHHTPTAHEAGVFEMVVNGTTAIASALKACGFSDEESIAWVNLVRESFSRHGGKLRGALSKVQPAYSGYDFALLYFLFVRVLRLSDQRSSDYIHKGGYEI